MTGREGNEDTVAGRKERMSRYSVVCHGDVPT